MDAGAVRVVVIGGPDTGASVVVEDRPCVVGRSETADLKVQDPTVSALHAELTAHELGIVVRDLGSVNGLVFAGSFVERGTVPSGSTIQLGSTLLKVELGATASSVHRDVDGFGLLLGTSGTMRALYALLSRVANTEASILIESPPGTEKEDVARSIHEASPRRGHPFVALDCGAYPGRLLASALYGDPESGVVGALDAAIGGTLFLDSVSEIPLELQADLSGALHRLAGPGGVRVVSSSSRDLPALVNRERFREDLYDRVAHFRVRLPPLRDRLEDLPSLVYGFLQKLPTGITAARAITRDALSQLKGRDYPDNLAGLRAVVERAAIVAKGPTIGADDLAFARMLEEEGKVARRPREEDDGELVPFKDAKRSLVDDFEREYLTGLLGRCGGNLSRASVLSGVERHHLRDLFKKHGLRGKDG